MMYPRLMLLNKLLAEDGAIFISIDDNEQANLKLVCDEIFGKLGFVGDVIWEKTDSPRMDVSSFSVRHDYILVYGKHSFCLKRLKNGEIPEHYNKIDEQGRRYYTKPMRIMGGHISESLFYPLIAPDGTEIYPYDANGGKSGWRWSSAKVIAEKERIDWVKGKKGWSPYFRIYAENRRETPAETLWNFEDVGSTRTAKHQINKILGQNIFDTPKPTGLIKRILEISGDENSIVLDSFAGSGTTAHAVLDLNKQDGGNRKFILCEMMDYAENITAERVRRVIKGYGEGNNKVEGTGGSFDFYEIGETIFDPVTENLNDNADIEHIRRYVWYSETNTPYVKPDKDAHPFLLGSYQSNNYYLYYIKGEETCLDWDFLNTFTQKDKAEMYIIYADRCVLTEEEMMRMNIRFKKLPRDLKRV